MDIDRDGRMGEDPLADGADEPMPTCRGCWPEHRLLRQYRADLPPPLPVTLNSRGNTGEDEHSDSRSSSSRHLDACARLLYDEAVTRNAGNSAIGSDLVVLAFEAYDVGLDHPNVMWGMWAQGHKEQITSDDYTFDPSAVDWNDFRDPLKDFWASRPPRALHEKVQPTSMPKAPGHRRTGDEALAWVRDRAVRRGERDKKSTVWPVTVYRGKWKLSRRCIVAIKLTERVESAWAEVTFNPSRLHDPLGTSVCPSELVEAYGKALLMRLAAENILVRSCPHLLATVESCETPSQNGGAPAQGGRATRAKAVPTQPVAGVRVPGPCVLGRIHA